MDGKSILKFLNNRILKTESFSPHCKISQLSFAPLQDATHHHHHHHHHYHHHHHHHYHHHQLTNPAILLFGGALFSRTNGLSLDGQNLKLDKNSTRAIHHTTIRGTHWRLQLSFIMVCLS